MAKVIVAFASDEQCARYASALEEAGIPVFRKCASAGEVRRTLDQWGDAVVVSACRFLDGTVDELAWDLGKHAVIIAVGRPPQLELCEHPDIFRLPVPCSRGELTSAVNMLIQLYRMRLPRRTADAQQTIRDAKQYLMDKRGMTEPQAHHHLQKGAMDQCMKMADFAAMILRTDP